jgi:methionyl-tRNA formyltransferase
MKVRVCYDPILRASAEPVSVFDAALKKEATAMIEAMHQHRGIGLAANQVGLNKRLIVFGYTPKDKDDDWPHIAETALCNPVVVRSSKETETATEGCLSLPGLELPVTRSVGVTVEAQDLTGKPITIKAKGLAARILQHEIDHINGVLFTDRALDGSRLKNYTFARIVFFGSDDFSLPVFTALADAGLNVLAVVTETDKPAGRGQTLQAPLMKQQAKDRHIAVFQPKDTAEIAPLLQQLQPDLLVLASYGKILPAEVLAIPTFGSLNVHPSLLPKYRGATPIQSAILNGETETGITIIQMSPQVDAGQIVAQETVALNGRETFVGLKNTLAQQGGALLVSTIPAYVSSQAKLQLQDPAAVTGTKKLTKEMGELNWEDSIDVLDRKIRALNPWPGTFTWLGKARLKILSAEIKDSRLLPVTVQLEGKKPAAWADFARGRNQELTKQAWYSKIYQ